MHSVLQGFPPDNNMAFGGEELLSKVVLVKANKTPERDKKLVCQACVPQ